MIFRLLFVHDQVQLNIFELQSSQYEIKGPIQILFKSIDTTKIQSSFRLYQTKSIRVNNIQNWDITLEFIDTEISIDISELKSNFNVQESTFGNQKTLKTDLGSFTYICSDGSYLDLQGQCKKCIQHCKSCDNQSTCIECYQGYYGQNCIICDKKCLACAYNDISCTSCNTSLRKDDPFLNCPCKDGYYEEQDECKACSKHCKSCTNNLECIECYAYRRPPNCECSDHFYDSGEEECDECDIICKKCYNPNICIECVQGMEVDENGKCLCQPGYYLQKSAGYSYCTQCIPPCTECINEYKCLKCKKEDGFAGVVRKDYSCYCMEGFYYSYSYCMECAKECSSCIDQTNCIQCSDHRDIYNQCKCIDGYLEDNGCKKCQFPCLTCINQVDMCVQCPKGRFGDKCECPNQQYSIDQVYECQKCSEKCNGCQDMKDKCTKCFTDQQRELDNNDCVCKIGYYDDNRNAECMQCKDECAECSSFNQCSKCKDENLMILEQLCECQDGYYFINDQCYQCSYKCKTCNDYSYCNICAENRLEEMNCQCKSSYFEQDQKCKPCSKKCQECSIEANNCTQCPYYTQIIKDGQCICGYGYYEQDDQCQRCDRKCSTCKSKLECTKCVTEHRSVKQQCNCIEGYYESQENCLKCGIQCKSCILYKDNCLECSSINRIIEEDCRCEKYYLDVGEQQCRKCIYPCLECIGMPDFCISCNDDRVLINDKCLCQQGYYEQNLQCNKCSDECKECSDLNTCTQCRQLQYLRENKCYCNDGYFKENNECYKCLEQCVDCYSIDDCTSCQDPMLMILPLCQCFYGYFMENQKCKVCNQQLCETCESKSDNCTVCSFNRENPPECHCQEGYLELNQSCKKCSSQCQQCSETLDNCITCDQLRVYPPECQCDSGYFEDESRNCQKCHYTCLTCHETKYKCSQCDLNRQNPPLCECIEGYYEKNQECFACNKICKSCTEFQCITCSQNRVQPPDCYCGPGYYEQDQVCHQCSSNCQRCESKKECISCFYGYYFYNNSCYKTCPKGTYQQDQQCLNCKPECLECTSLNVCLQCNAQYVKMDQVCIQSCPIGYYTNLGECYKCHRTCKTCYNEGVRGCTSCQQDKQLIQNMCLSDCQDDYDDCTICLIDDDDSYCLQYLKFVDQKIEYNEQAVENQIQIYLKPSTNFERTNSEMISRDDKHQLISLTIEDLLYTYHITIKNQNNQQFLVLYLNLQQSTPKTIAQLYFSDPYMFKDNNGIILNPGIKLYEIELRQCLIPNNSQTNMIRTYDQLQQQYLSTPFFQIIKDIGTNIQLISFILNAAQPIAQLLLINTTMPVNAYRIISILASPVIFSIPSWEQENQYQNYSYIHSFFFQFNIQQFQRVPFRFRRIQLTGCFLIDAILPILMLTSLGIVFLTASVGKAFLYVPKLRIGNLKEKLTSNPQYLQGEMEKERQKLSYQRYLKYQPKYGSYYKPQNRDLVKESYGLSHLTLNLIFLIFEGNLWLILSSSFLQIKIFGKDNLMHWFSLPIIIFIYTYLLLIIIKSSADIMRYTYYMNQRIPKKSKFKPSRSILQLFFPFNYIEPEHQKKLLWIKQIHSFSFSQISLSRPIYFIFHQISFFKKFIFILILVLYEDGEEQLKYLLLLNGTYFFVFYVMMKPFALAIQNLIHIMAELTYILILYLQLQSYRIYLMIEEQKNQIDGFDLKTSHYFFALGEVMYFSSFTYLLLYLLSMIIEPLQNIMIQVFVFLPILTFKYILKVIKELNTQDRIDNLKIYDLHHSLVLSYLLEVLDFQDFMMVNNNKPFERVFNKQLQKQIDEIRILGQYKFKFEKEQMKSCLGFDYFRTITHPNIFINGCQLDQSDNDGCYYWIKYNEILKSNKLRVIKKILCDISAYDLIRKSVLCDKISFGQIKKNTQNVYREDDLRYWCWVDYLKRNICINIPYQKDLIDIQLELQQQGNDYDDLVVSLNDINRNGRVIGLMICILNDINIESIENKVIKDEIGDEWIVLKYK